MRVAAFDCGTNSLRLLIADLDPATGSQHELVREMRVVRLGEGVDRTGRISEASMQRAFAALDEYAVLVAEHAPERIRFCATSAARDAENAAEFTEAVRSRIGVEVEVIAGEEEARASFAGATMALAGQGFAMPCLVLDIGGGSTEFILGDPEGGVRAAQSLDIGSVRLTERLIASDPPSPAELAAVRAEIDAVLDVGLPDRAGSVGPLRVPIAQAATVVGVAGTVTTVAAAVLDLPEYSHEAIHLARLPLADVEAAIARLAAMTVAERRALGFMHPGRADVIVAGALIVERILQRTSVTELVVSESDILDGIAWSA